MAVDSKMKRNRRFFAAFISVFLVVSCLLSEPIEALAAKPKTSLAYKYYTRGTELALHKKWEDALKQFQSAIDLNPAFVTSYIEYARTAVMMGKRQLGLQKLDAAIEITRSKEDKERIQRERENLSDIFYTNETFQQYQNGLNYLKLDRPRSALDALEKALRTEPDNLLVLTAYAKALKLEERPKDSMAALERALELNSSKREVRLDLAEASLGPTPERSLSLLQPLQGSIADERAVILKAQALSQLKRNREAIETVRVLYDKQPTALYASFWLGKLYAREPNGAWNARKYLMTFLRRSEPQALSWKDDLGSEARLLKGARGEAELLLANVNKSLE
jgi:tetratricopeptide (TPR) repeat protein